MRCQHIALKAAVWGPQARDAAEHDGGGGAAEAGEARLPARRAGGLRPPTRFLKKLGCYSNPCRFRAGRRRLASNAASRIFTTSQGRNGTTQAEKLAKNGVPERMEYHRVPKK